VSISILFAVNDSPSSRAAVDYLAALPLCHEEVSIKIIHVLRKPSAGEDLMGKKFIAEQSKRYGALLEQTKERLVQSGFLAELVDTELILEPYDTVSDGIMDRFAAHKYDMVVIGRKQMSKAEEFVLGDPSVKLVRALGNTAILVIKS